MKEALREAGVPCAQSIGGADSATRSGRSPTRSASRSSSSRATAPAPRAPTASTTPPSSTARSRAVSVDHGAAGGRRGVHRGPRGLLRHDHDRRPRRRTTSSRTTTRTCSRRCATRWISPQFVTTNRIDAAAATTSSKRARPQVIEALGIGTSATHMEWFSGPKGLKFSRDRLPPAGRRARGTSTPPPTTSTSTASGRWPSSTATSASRRRAASPPGSSRCGPTATAHRRLRRARRGPAAATASGSSTPTCRAPGTPTQPVEAGYMANAWVRMRHPDYDALREMLDDVGRTVHVRAS